MSISLIYAQSDNGVIGSNNDLPWHQPADLKRFKKITTGHTIIMGRKTFESIGRPLPNRRSIVLSRDPSFVREGVDVAISFDDALAKARNEPEVFVIGGAEVFQQALPHARTVYRTTVHAIVDGDVTIPPLEREHWQLVDTVSRGADDDNEYAMTFEVFRRPTRSRLDQ